ncbi:uncharacterized protein LOC118738739 [Rhagoletis pomonella]|uniref:uncharacterized protein LOC118738739 n=1 Tax=Rhagoletis pomonella TaxID=28610 RepID=UPI0017818113|nr:uncharacterized protein LOC118738739 [Rhagoletis pomonella]
MHPCLFDKGDFSYRSKLAKEKAWKSVAAATNANVQLCQNRWRSLRDRYLKEVKAGKLPSGSAAAEGSGWRFFEPMSFLQRYVAPRRTISNIEWLSEDPIYSESGQCFDVESDGNMSFMNDPSEIVTPNEVWDCIECEAAPPTAPPAVPPAAPPTTPLTAPPTASKTSKRTEKRQKDEDRFDGLCGAVSDWIQKESKPISRNTGFFKVLDGYLMKYTDDEQGEIKIKLLSFVSSYRYENTV